MVTLIKWTSFENRILRCSFEHWILWCILSQRQTIILELKVGKVGICVKYREINIYKVECVRTKFLSVELQVLVCKSLY